MKRARLLLTSISFLLGSFLMPLIGGRALASTCPVEQCTPPDPLQCQQTVTADIDEVSQQFIQRGLTEGCDLGIDKQVSVNGRAFVEADTSADAAQATVGDSVTWQITVTNTSDQNLTPYGKLTVQDILPAGVQFDSYTTSAGTYSSNDWTFDLANNLPATLTIVSHAVATGLFENVATLSAYDPCSDGCLGAGAYADSNPDNDSNVAWMDPSAKPVVLGETTETPQVLGLTGNSPIPSILAGVILASTIAIAGYGRWYRKPKNP